MKNLFTTTNLLLLSISIITLFKLSLINKGFYTFDDERRYFKSAEILKSLSEFKIQQSVEQLFSIQGRPGEALIKLFPSILQHISAIGLGYLRFESQNSFPLFFFNTILFTLILVVHYKFSLLFLKSKTLSLFSVLVFSTLIISYISLRHADPYDCSLLILYYVLYKMALKTKENFFQIKSMFFYGFLAFFGFSCYPGYILLFLATPLIYFFSSLQKSNALLKIKNLSIYFLGSTCCLLAYEAFSQTVNKSYIGESLILSKTIIQGSFDECFSFLFKYLSEAEGAIGLFLIIGLMVYVLVFIHQFYTRKEWNNFHVLITILFLTFFMYSALGYYFEKVVWYARLIKQYIPFIILATLYSIQYFVAFLKIDKRYLNYSLLGITVFFVSHFCVQISEYKTYYYPYDVVWDYYNSDAKAQTYLVYEDVKNAPKNPEMIFKKEGIKATKKYYCTFSRLYPFTDINTYSAYKPNKNEKLVFSKPSYANFKAYQFEGYNPKERSNIDKINLQIKVYEVR